MYKEFREIRLDMSWAEGRLVSRTFSLGLSTRPSSVCLPVCAPSRLESVGKRCPLCLSFSLSLSTRSSFSRAYGKRIGRRRERQRDRETEREGAESREKEQRERVGVISTCTHIGKFPANFLSFQTSEKHDVPRGAAQVKVHKAVCPAKGSS